MTDAGTDRRLLLGSWPTPVEPAPRLSEALGLAPNDLWLKRDDLTGLGGGGNKIRKLEWTCGLAVAEGATVLVTTGGAQSNHARLTAAAGARLGLHVVLVLAGAAQSPAAGNLVLDGLFGATVVWAGDVGPVELDARAGELAEQLRRRGGVPAVIPFGGSSVLGARGYVECGRELLAQLPELRTVVTAVGSGGTMAGLVAELGGDKVLGVDCGAVPDPAATVARLAAGVTGRPCPPEDLRLRLDQVGDGYGTLTGPVMEALLLAARTEGLVLEPVYTGRALAGLAAAVRDGDIERGERTVLLHSGGMPGLFGHAAAVREAEAELNGERP